MFRSDNLEKVKNGENLNEKEGTTNDVSLFLDLLNVKDSLLCRCLALVVCSNTTLLKLQTVLFSLFSKFCASKSGVRLIHGRLRYLFHFLCLTTKQDRS